MTAPTEFDYRAYLPTVPLLPGVYQMFDASGTVLYVGKARQLRKRLSSYFRPQPAVSKTALLVARIERIETIVTHTEAEALILENRLIKTFNPKYNILLRDDKSYPYLRLSRHHPFPVLSIYRGVRRSETDFSLAPMPILVQHALRCIICRPFSNCVSAVTRFSPIVPGRACSIRSTGAAGPVSAISAVMSTRDRSSRWCAFSTVTASVCSPG